MSESVVSKRKPAAARPASANRMEASTLGAKWRLADKDVNGSGDGSRFSWGQQAAQFQHLHEFKEAMVKDRECIALIGALMMTISFSYVLSQSGKECPREVELLWLLAQSLAAVLSSLSTLVALHGVLLINTSSSEQTVALLQSVHENRWWKKAHPFKYVLPLLCLCITRSTPHPATVRPRDGSRCSPVLHAAPAYSDV